MDVELSVYFSSLPSIRKKLLFLRYKEIVVAVHSLGKRSIRFSRFVNQSLKPRFDELHFGKPVLRQKLVYFFGIHKAKGREFDCVYLLLNNILLNTDEQRRKIYVGITRAKEELFVHYNTDIFPNVPIEIIEDEKTYNEPDELTLQFTHRDVVLDFFKDKTSMIVNLRSGDILQYSDGYLSAPINGRLCNVVKFSKACIEKICKLNEKGYTPISAKVRYEVIWKGKDDEKETVIILPEVIFEKIENS